jgi:hypothetical protein
MRQENNRCLVLNGDYSPLGIIDWKRAVIWSLKYEHSSHKSIEVLDFYKNDFIIGAHNKKYPIPAVIKTCKYFKLHNQRVNFSRKNLFIRDNYVCQYCGIEKDINELTYDHVIPKSHFKSKNSTPTSWTNIVTACTSCNRRKANKTPKQANMPLLNLPIEPKKHCKYLPVTRHLSIIRDNMPQEWTIYLPQSYTE